MLWGKPLRFVTVRAVSSWLEVGSGLHRVPVGLDKLSLNINGGDVATVAQVTSKSLRKHTYAHSADINCQAHSRLDFS